MYVYIYIGRKSLLLFQDHGVVNVVLKRTKYIFLP